MAKKPPLFLERDTYRYRRAVDAARLLPVLGVLLWLIPAFWSQSKSSETSLSQAMLYIFVVWIILIALCALVSTRIARRGDAPSETGFDAGAAETSVDGRVDPDPRAES